MSGSLKHRGVVLGTLMAVGATAVAVTVGVLAGVGVAASAAAPQNTSPPTITGIPQEGHTLHGEKGNWTDSPTFTFFWLRCDKTGGSCAAIGGATTKNYTLTSVDVGNTLRFRVKATNASGSTFARSVPTAVIAAAAAPPPATGCPAGNGAVQVSQLTPPARLQIDGQQVNPPILSRSTQQVTLRYHVSACNGRSVQGALVYATGVPYHQLTNEAEAPTDATGWATITYRMLSGYPASPRQQLLAVFVRARKSGENPLGGISTRRLFSVPVRL